ncbi:hypothetical protein Tco_0947323, partial [Tanacetum coccineum]
MRTLTILKRTSGEWIMELYFVRQQNITMADIFTQDRCPQERFNLLIEKL